MVRVYTQLAKVHFPPSNYSYSDTGIFLHDDRAWYLLTSADHNVVQINRINSDGAVGGRVTSFAEGARANPNKVLWATSLSGTWSGGTYVAPAAENTLPVWVPLDHH
ncbi:putative galactanbeta-galactosidase [Diaporthe ampelina]|uniref:Putative galactanbeta-galactosidase n=1 Tax=Diaporthe ampelina TaxID=1214573 RepID=A0A0G2HY53_9PEZI|nr:putative galactanbeta-galactosidase [Diaporthe ampelina]